MEFFYSASDYVTFINDILEHGAKTSPRGIATVEVINANIIVDNPRRRLIADPARKMNIAFAIKEFAQLIVGKSLLNFITDVNPRMSDFSFQTRVDAAYGSRVVNEQQNQIEQCIAILKQDPDSRQAIISIWRKDDLWKWNNKPCTISLQFLLRNDHLNCIATMRSCDAVWGFSYDMFSFTMLQEYIAARLSVGLGMYYHNAGSLHVYVDRDHDMIDQLQYTNSLQMESMSSLNYAQLWAFYKLLEMPIDKPLGSQSLPSDWEDLALTVRAFKARKNASQFTAIFDQIGGAALRQILENFSPE